MKNLSLSLKVMVIGAGAAGNKAVLSLLKNKIIRIDEAMLVNSTDRDLPSDINVLSKDENTKVKFVNIAKNVDDGGSAKEPKIAERLTINAIKSGVLKLDNIPAETDLVIFIGSLEGGTGNGSIPVMAKYVRDRIGKKVHIIAIKGFAQDARGLDNTVNFFKKMQSNYAIECIDNSKFLSESKNDFFKAQELANKEIVSRVSVLRGLTMFPSDQNIDEKELRKISTREGFVDIEYYEIDDYRKIKNSEMFDEIIKEIIDNSKGLEVTPSQKCMGVIINLPEVEQKYIDFKFESIKETYGNPFEVYTHIQNIPDMERFISFICTGMKMPIDEIRKIRDNFNKEFNAIDTEEDNFLKELRSFESTPAGLFDMDDDLANNVPTVEDSKEDVSKFLDNMFNDDFDNAPDDNDIGF